MSAQNDLLGDEVCFFLRCTFCYEETRCE